MIKYFFTHFFHKRVQIIIIIILILVTALAIGLANPLIGEAELLLNINSFNDDYQEKVNIIIKYILMFSVSLILIDHDAIFIKPLISYFGREKISFYKLIFYLLLTTCFTIIVYAIIVNVGFILTPYYKFKLIYFNEYLKIGVDMLILTLILLIIVRDSRKSISFLTLIILIIISFIQEDNNLLWLSYLMPLSSSSIYQTTNYLWYLITYNFSLVLIYFITFTYENI